MINITEGAVESGIDTVFGHESMVVFYDRWKEENEYFCNSIFVSYGQDIETCIKTKLPSLSKKSYEELRNDIFMTGSLYMLSIYNVIKTQLEANELEKEIE